MDLSEYIKQKTTQDLYKAAASKEYHPTSVKDRIEQIKNDRRQTRDTLLSSYRNLRNMSPITPTPTKNIEQSKVLIKKATNNNMREKLAKWRAEKERIKLEAKKKMKPVFKVSHVPDKIELPLEPYSKLLAPLNHQFVPPKNIIPIEFAKSSGLSKPVEKKVIEKYERSDNKIKTTTSSNARNKPKEKKPTSLDKRNLNENKSTKTTDKNPPSCVKKKLNENKTSKTLSISKPVIKNDNKKIMPQLMKKVNSSQPSGQKITNFVSDKVNKAKLNASKRLQSLNQKKKTTVKKNVSIKGNDITSSGINDVDSHVSPNKKATVSGIQKQGDEENREPLNYKGYEPNNCFKSEYESDSEPSTPEKGRRNVRFGSQIGSSNDVFVSPTRLRHHSGILRIQSEDNVLSGPSQTKPWREDAILYNDDEVCVKSPAVRRLRESFKSSDSQSTPGISDFYASTDSASSFQYVTKRKLHRSSTKISDADILDFKPSVPEETSDDTTRKSLETRKGSRLTVQNSVTSNLDVLDPKTPISPSPVELDSLKRRSSTKKDREQRQSREGIAKRYQSSSSSGINDVDSHVSPNKTATVSGIQKQGDEENREPLNYKGSENEYAGESPTPAKGRRNVRFGSQRGSSNDDVFVSPTRLRHHSGILRIQSEGNVVLSGPSQTKKYKTTPYRSRRQDVILFSDDEVCVKSPAAETKSKLRRSSTKILESEPEETSVVTTRKSLNKWKSSEISGIVAMRKSINTPTRKGRTSTVQNSVSVTVLDPKTPISSEDFDSPSLKMSLRSRLRTLANPSTQRVRSESESSQDSKSSKTAPSSAKRRSLRASINKRPTSSIEGASHPDSNTLESLTLENRKTLNRMLDKYLQNMSPKNEVNSNSGESQKEVEPVPKTPDAKKAFSPSSDTVTPEQKGKRESVYLSPFVTISRGKSSARKEFHIRSSTGGTLPGAEATTSPKAGAQYFKNLLNEEIRKIEEKCDEWNKCKETGIPEEAVNMIDVAVGQSKLLVAKKFNQFRRLIERCQSGDEERGTVTCQDLHGFWDMVFLQVEDVEKRFNNLKRLKENNWQEVITVNKVVKAKKERKTKAQATSKIKEMIAAARKRTKKSQNPSSNDLPTISIEGVKDVASQKSTPRKSLTQPSGSSRRSLRASLLTNQLQQKRRNSSPGLAIMNLSQSIKLNDGLTPGRSILKSRSSKSEKRITKTVLFKEDLHEERRFDAD
ncbi:unnamed protein product [Acanthoscelides obtectus]|nr:unnamed protein product [Acanthoscelides obtectus]CAK1671459.1 Guanylate kinase-associated protein mars [Acanthoscelides obtectus]